MDQQRVIDKMKAERRETICVQAHQRQELERDLCEAEKKVSSTQHANSVVTSILLIYRFTQIRQDLLQELLKNCHLNGHTPGFLQQT